MARDLGPSVVQLACDEAAAHARARTAGVDADGDGGVVLRAQQHAVPLERLAEGSEREVAVGALLRGEVLRQARRHRRAAQPVEHIELARDDEPAWAG